MKHHDFSAELDRNEISSSVAKRFKLASCLFSVLFVLMSNFAVATPPRPQDDFFQNANDAWLETADAKKSLCSTEHEKIAYIKNKVTTDCDSDMVRQMHASLSANDDNKKRAIKFWLDKITSVNSPAQIPELVADLRKIGVVAFMDIRAEVDDFDGQVIPKFVADNSIGTLYNGNVEEVFETAGEKLADDEEEADRITDEIVKIQEAIDELPIGDSQTPETHKLADISAEKTWGAYFKSLVGGTKNIDVLFKGDYQDYIFSLNKIFRDFSPDDLKAYLKFRFLNKYAELLSSPTHQDIEDIFGSDLNRLCFEKYIALHRGKMLEIIGNVKTSYDNEITKSTVWDDKSKPRAKAKLDAITYLFEDGSGGVDYSKIKIDPKDPIGNVMNIKRLQYQHIHDMFGKKQDPKEFKLRQKDDLWKYLSYQRILNKIVIPISSMIPPVFNPKGEDALNYGSFGASIGHEISHAFDSEGIIYNERGEFENWITNEDRKNFDSQKQKLIDQYKNYHDFSEKTVDEDAADILGLRMAYNACQIALKGKPIPPQFYYSFAILYRTNWCPKVEAHSTEAARTNGALKNQPGFRDVFGVKPGDGMYIANPVSVW